MRTTLATFATIAGCVTEAPTVQAPVATPGSELAPRAAAIATAPASPEIAGAWTGTYVCRQGKTGLHLTIETLAGGRLSGKFVFYPVPENSGVPNGSFTMTGVFTGHHVVLDGGEWIQQPENYETVGLSGDVSADGSIFEGRVDNPGCDGFRLRRSAPDP
jgi:hypothetical protein